MNAGTQTLAVRASSDEQGHPALPNHRTQSATAIDGWKSVLFGLPFAAVGAAIGWAAINRNPAAKHGQIWVIGMFGAIFFLPGLFFVVHGLRGVTRKAIWKRQAAQYPSEPWRCDFHWHREGVAFSAFDDMLKRLLAALLWTAFLVPFGWIGATERGARVFLYFSILFGLAGLYFWFRWAAMLFDFLRFGNSYLSYESFPYFLGGTLRARLRCPRHVSAIETLTLTLRCVQEKYVTSDSGKDRTTSVVCYELYKNDLNYDRARLTGFGGGDIPIEFDVPPNQPATTLIATPPTYWEIEAKGKARGVDYEAVFLVPVYAVS